MWKTIDSAPKDGTEILLYALAKDIYPERKTLGNWYITTACDEESGWISWDGGFTEDNPPTHWSEYPETNSIKTL